MKDSLFAFLLHGFDLVCDFIFLFSLSFHFLNLEDGKHWPNVLNIPNFQISIICKGDVLYVYSMYTFDIIIKALKTAETKHNVHKCTQMALGHSSLKLCRQNWECACKCAATHKHNTLIQLYLCFSVNVLHNRINMAGTQIMTWISHSSFKEYFAYIRGF